MQEITVTTFPTDKNQIVDLLSSNGILINEYAKTFLNHPDLYSVELPSEITLVICSLSELGFSDGAIYHEIVSKIKDCGLFVCKPLAGVFLRLAYHNQVKSRDSSLSGSHRSPDGAIVVFSELLENDDSFPKGLYLRNVDGNLWLRGYVCDDDYLWSGEDLFAFQKI